VSSKLIKLLFFIFFSTKAFADLSTEAYVFLDPLKVDELLKEFLPESFDIEGIGFELGNFDDLEGMNFDSPELSLKMSPFVKSSSDGKLIGNLIVHNASLVLRNFSYREVRYIDQGTVKARVNVNVDCSELVLGFTNSVGFLEATPLIHNGKLSFPKSKRGFSLEPNRLTVDLSQCDAPRNIEGLFIEALEEWVESADAQLFIAEQAFDAVEDYVNELVEDLLSNQVLLGNEFSFSIKSLDFVNGGWRLGLSLVILNEEELEVKFLEAPLKSTSKANQIQIPKGLLSKILPIVVNSLNLPIAVERNQIPGIDRLFNSRLIQFFAWRDLTNFQKDVNFNLEVFFFNNKLRYLTEQNGQIYFRIKNNHWMDMNFLSGETKFPYIQMLGETDAQVGLKFEGDEIKLQLLDIGAETGVNFHPKMTDWRQSDPSGLPSMSLILPNVLSGLEGFEYSLNFKEIIGDLDAIKNIEFESFEETISAGFD